MRPLEGVRELRERRMLSQQELADRAGVSLFTVQRIERGEGGVRPKTGRAIAAALSVGVEDLLGKAQAPLFQESLDTEIAARRDIDFYAQAIEDAGIRWEEAAALSVADTRSLVGLAGAILDLSEVLGENLEAQEHSAPQDELDHGYAIADQLDSIVEQCIKRIEKGLAQETPAAADVARLDDFRKRAAARKAS